MHEESAWRSLHDVVGVVLEAAREAGRAPAADRSEEETNGNRSKPGIRYGAYLDHEIRKPKRLPTVRQAYRTPDTSPSWCRMNRSRVVALKSRCACRPLHVALQ